MRTLVILSCAVLGTALTTQLGAAPVAPLASHTLAATNAAGAWAELNAAIHPPPDPPEWTNKAPTPEEKEAYYLPYVLAVTDQAKDFYTRYPTNEHAFEARQQEMELTTIAIQYGATNMQARMEVIEDGLAKDYPDRPDVLQFLLQSADESDPPRARELYQKIIASIAPDPFKNAATNGLKKLDAVGKPVDLDFTAVDGRKVDLAAMKGKVVLLDFWATWCPPCVREVPNVKAAYDELHPQGLEIVGISLDKEKDKLTKFVAEHNMAWPQYFDGLYWQNKYAQQFGIGAVPSMWLIDKKGNLRYLNGREDLNGKIKKLLAEKS
jgi:peroxiredoxin